MKIRQLALASIFVITVSGFDYITSHDPYEAQRLRMVRNQIVKRGITDQRVIRAMEQVPRHEFVTENYLQNAYDDTPLPIGMGQTISQPYVVALMTELLTLKADDKVLEIGTGSGYQAAVLAELVQSVFSIEIVPYHAERAQEILQRLGYHSVTVKSGDGFFGWPEEAPFDAIIITAAPVKVPQPLLDQLAENGRLIVPEGEYFQTLMIYTKKHGKITVTSSIPVRFVPMTGYSDSSQ
ncbi:MAG: protein-L-isoaspartate(D-aspartate) O-methyltransferase [Candidatus Auribacterota bacterium]